MSSFGHRIMCIYRLRPALNYGLCDKAIYTNSMYSVGTHTNLMCIIPYRDCKMFNLKEMRPLCNQQPALVRRVMQFMLRSSFQEAFLEYTCKVYVFQVLKYWSWNSSVISNTWSSQNSELSWDTRFLCLLAEASSRIKSLNMQKGSASFYPFESRYPDTCTEAISYS